MRKIFMFFAALVCGLTVNAKTLYLNPGVWETEGAKFALYFFNSPQDNAWGDYMTKNGSVYQGEMPDKFANVIFVRMDPNKGKDWNGKWNQTYDLAVPSDKNLYSISGWGDSGQPSPGDWSVYNGGNQGGGNQGGGNQGGQGGSDAAGYEFYAMGWINGADAGETAYKDFNDKYKFVDGKLTIDCQMGSYIAVKDDDGNFYYSRTQTQNTDTKVTLEFANGWSGGQKWAIPEGVNYIVIRSIAFQGKIELERVDKATYDAYHLDMGGGSGSGDSGSGSGETQPGGEDKKPDNQAVENTPVVQKAHKVFVDGQLRIIRGDIMFDATGRKL